MRSGTAHFRITGAAFTCLVQQRMLDDAPDAAYRLAVSIHSGDPTIDDTIPRIAQRLCDGEAALEGDESALRVVSRTHRKYRTRIAWLHAGRIRLSNKWYQPVAYVRDVGPTDLQNDHGIATYTPSGGRGIVNRAWHYCGKDEIVVDHVSFKDPESPHLEREVIFRACVERPHWHQPPMSPQAALDEYLAAGRPLERRGHSVSYGCDPEQWPAGYAGKSWQREPHEPNEKAMRRKLEEQEREAREKAEEASRLLEVAKLRLRILEQAGDDLVELAWEARGEVPAGKAMVPRAPFLLWAFSRLRWYERLLPAWRTISPGGMKMAMDDPNHTDWVIGGGFDPLDRDLYWGGAKADAANRLKSWLQDEFDERERAEDEKVTTLVTGAKVTSVVVHGLPGVTPTPGLVVVIPNLHTRYLWAAQGAAAVITEEGGEVAHLVQVAREQALPVVRAERALERWSEGDVVEVNPEARTVRVVRRAIRQPEEGDADSGE